MRAGCDVGLASVRAVTAQGAAKQGMEARQTARALLAHVRECWGGGIDGHSSTHSDSQDSSVQDALPSVLARAAAARNSADKPQVPAPSLVRGAVLLHELPGSSLVG